MLHRSFNKDMNMQSNATRQQELRRERSNACQRLAGREALGKGQEMHCQEEQHPKDPLPARTHRFPGLPFPQGSRSSSPAGTGALP